LKSTASTGKNKIEMLTDKSSNLFLELAGDSFNSEFAIKFSGSEEKVEVKKGLANVCNC
jgi:hypothetical protein